MRNGEKRFIPGTNPDWNLELPDGDLNSLVTKDGKSWDNSYNFDEKDEDTDMEVTCDSLAGEVEFNPEFARRYQKENQDQNHNQADSSEIAIYNPSLIGEKIEKEGYVKIMPRFCDQVEDSTRTNNIIFKKENRALLQNTSTEGDIYKLTEHDSLMALRNFFEKNSNDPNVSRQLQSDARAMIDSLNYLGVKEFSEAASGLADYYKKFLDENPEKHLVLSLVSDFNDTSTTKSDIFVLDKILENFSDEELEKYGSRLHRYITEIDTLPPELVKYVVLDDWSISGEQLSNLKEHTNLKTGKIYKPEINLLIAKKAQLQNGFKYEQGDEERKKGGFLVRSYYVAREDERFINTEGYMGQARITGFHSSVDYGFEEDISRMIANKGGTDIMPPLTNIVRPYRQDNYEPKNVKRCFGRN